MREARWRFGRVVNRADGGRDAWEDRDGERKIQRQHEGVPPQQPQDLSHRRPATTRDGVPQGMPVSCDMSESIYLWRRPAEGEIALS